MSMRACIEPAIQTRTTDRGLCFRTRLSGIYMLIVQKDAVTQVNTMRHACFEEGGSGFKTMCP